ncbi:DUF732 domain-containing protein [Mycobacterium intracellulare]|uniref:DUF732 domain-containing protein n=1 Tax=Mycobacterium intracellulare TaxID=1767 RepID=UPI0039772B25
MTGEDTELAPSKDATAYLALAYDDGPPSGAALAYSDVPDDPLPRRRAWDAVAEAAARAGRSARPYLAMFCGAVVTATAVMLVAVGGGHPAHRAVDTAPAVAPPAAAAPKAATPAPKPAVAVDPPPAPATQPAEPPRPVKTAAPAEAPRQRPPAATDDQYLAALHAHGIGVNADRTTAIQNGRLICTAIDNGLPLGHIEDTVAAQEQGHLTAAAVPVYIRLSVDAYCPEYSFLLPSAS